MKKKKNRKEGKEMEKIKELETELLATVQEAPALKSIAELGINPIPSTLAPGLATAATQAVEALELAQDVEELEKQKKILSQTEKVLKEKRKAHFKNLKEDEKSIMGIEKALKKKEEEVKKELEELNAEITQAKITLTISVFNEYYEEKERQTFDFVDWEFVKNYIEKKHVEQHGKPLDYSLSKWTTETGNIAKPGKDLIDFVIDKFSSDYLAVVQGEPEHIARKLELYKLNDYNINTTLEAFNSWLLAEKEKQAEIERQAEIKAQEKIKKEEQEKLLREQARIEFEKKQAAEAEARQAAAEQAIAAEQAAAEAQYLAEELEIIEPEIEEVEIKKEVVTVGTFEDTLVEVEFMAIGTKEDIKLVVKYAKELGVEIKSI